MSKGIGVPMYYTSRLAGIAIALLLGITIALPGNDGTVAAKDVSTNTIVCAEREVLVMVLVEAHGAFPSVADSATLIEARTACANGHVRHATRLYERLVTNLRTSLAQDGED